MKKTSRFLILTLLSFCIVLPAFAWRSTTYYIKDSLKYCVREDSSYVMVSVMAVSDSLRLPVTENGTLVIPASVTIEGRTYKVGDIEDEGFRFHPEIKHLVLSEGIEFIGNNAFWLCLNLESIHFPTTFSGMEISAFKGCSGLKSITVEYGNKTFDSRDNCNALIKTKWNELVLGCQSTQVPEGIVAIGSGAFSGQQNLECIILPNSLKEIGNYAFIDCTGLKQVTLPDSLETIRNQAFAGCTSLEKLFIPASVSKIEERIVTNCPILKRLVVSPENKTYDSRDNCNAIIKSKDNCLIAGCCSTNIVDGIKSIAKQALWGSGITSISIPASVTQISEEAFSYCRFCSSIEVAADNPVYDSRENCNAIIETSTGTLVKGCGVTSFPKSVSKIGNYAFCGMTLPSNLVIPEGITAIGEYAFTGCRFYSLVLPKSLRDIGFSAFTHCQDMERVVMNCIDLQIGSHAFCYCYSLYAVQLPQNISFKSSNTFEYTPYQEIFEREYGRR